MANFHLWRLSFASFPISSNGSTCPLNTLPLFYPGLSSSWVRDSPTLSYQGWKQDIPPRRRWPRCCCKCYSWSTLHQSNWDDRQLCRQRLPSKESPLQPVPHRLQTRNEVYPCLHGRSCFLQQADTASVSATNQKT